MYRCLAITRMVGMTSPMLRADPGVADVADAVAAAGVVDDTPLPMEAMRRTAWVRPWALIHLGACQ